MPSVGRSEQLSIGTITFYYTQRKGDYYVA